jgi:3-isopropylmalate dehydrogenase
MNIANPIAMIASLGMALKYSLEQKELADKIDAAIKEFISQGYRTKDISTNDEYVKTSEVAAILIGILKNG